MQNIVQTELRLLGGVQPAIERRLKSPYRSIYGQGVSRAVGGTGHPRLGEPAGYADRQFQGGELHEDAQAEEVLAYERHTVCMTASTATTIPERGLQSRRLHWALDYMSPEHFELKHARRRSNKRPASFHRQRFTPPLRSDTEKGQVAERTAEIPEVLKRYASKRHRQRLMVPGTGIEPVRSLSGKRRILSPLCLPISPPGQRLHQTWPAYEKSAQGAFFGIWRRGSESNRRLRLCRPLHNLFATPP